MQQREFITKNARNFVSQEKQGRQIGLQLDGYFSHDKGRIQLEAHSWAVPARPSVRYKPRIFTPSYPAQLSRMAVRGLQCFKLNGNHTEKDRYWQKITFYFLQNVWKCTVFFAFAFKVCKKCFYDPKIFFLEKYQSLMPT